MAALNQIANSLERIAILMELDQRRELCRREESASRRGRLGEQIAQLEHKLVALDQRELEATGGVTSVRCPECVEMAEKIGGVKLADRYTPSAEGDFQVEGINESALRLSGGRVWRCVNTECKRFGVPVSWAWETARNAGWDER